MKQYTESQYDDDLTVGTDDYDDSYYTDSDDLFGFSTDEESPINRLKSLILSIDWEITDDVLMQFNEELMDLRDIWAGNKVNLVYVQALEKISKYIYQKKANSHPSAIKLLLTLYHNLERIVSTDDLSDEEKKEILVEDVKRFEGLKRLISRGGEPAVAGEAAPRTSPVSETTEVAEEEGGILLNLKAIVLGIDWEITDQDLNDLRQEVVRLEAVFADSRPKLILLQGIGTLGAYIKLKKSNAHADAFKVLHLFYESLEKITNVPMSLEEEKSILFPAVERFNAFKSLLGPTISPEAISRKEEEPSMDEYPADTDGFVPALADVPPGEEMGFQAEQEAMALGLEDPINIDSHVDTFFMGENGPSDPESGVDPGEATTELADTTLAGLDDSDRLDVAQTDAVSRELALQGVEVEADDEEESLEQAISETVAESTTQEGDASIEEDVFSAEFVEDDLSVQFPEEAATTLEADEESTEPIIAEGDDELSADEETVAAVESLFADSGTDDLAENITPIDKETALQGVKVESEADDDSGEEALPMFGDELAPALAENDEVSLFNAEFVDENVSVQFPDETTAALEAGEDVVEPSIAAGDDELSVSEEPVAAVESLFADSDTDDSAKIVTPVDKETALQGVKVESEADDDSGEEALPMFGDELAPALAENDEVSLFNEEFVESSDSSLGVGDELSEKLDGFFEEQVFSEDHLAFAGEEQLNELEPESEAETSLRSLDPIVEDNDLELGAPAIQEDEDYLQEKQIAIEGEDSRLHVSAGDAIEIEESEVVSGISEEDEFNIFDDGIEAGSDDILDHGDRLTETLDEFFQEETVTDEVFTEPLKTDSFPESSVLGEDHETEPAIETTTEAAFFESDITEEEDQGLTAKVESSSDESHLLEGSEIVLEGVEEDGDYSLDALPENDKDEDNLTGDLAAVSEDEEIEADIFGQGSEEKTDQPEQLATDIEEVDNSLFTTAEEIEDPFAEHEPLMETVVDERDLDSDKEDDQVKPAEDSVDETDHSLDAFFALGEGVEEPGEDKLLLSLPEKEVITDTDETEEEVIFELIEDDASEIADQSILEEFKDDVGLQQPLFTQTAVQDDEVEEAEEIIVEETGGQADVGDDQNADEGTVAQLADVDEEEGSGFLEAQPLGTYHDLSVCIDSLAVELDGKVTSALLAEINSLRQKWVERPLEKTFLQLMSTVAQHIDTYRYESSAEALGILQDVFAGLSKLEDERSLQKNQELLLTCTHKVLEWQQGMLARQAVKMGEELTFVDPVRAESGAVSGGSDARVEFEDELEQFQDKVAAGDKDGGADEPVIDADDFEPSFQAMEEGPGGQPPVTGESLPDDIRQEIAALRRILQSEIAELRRELKGGS